MVRAVALVVSLASCAVAAAQPDPEGARLFEQGRALARDGKYAEACEKFARSLELDPAIGTQLNYADCHEKLGRHAEAWRLFDGVADAEKITNPTRARFARERADALLPKLGVIVLELATPDAPRLAVSIGGRKLEPAPVIREIVAPGDVAIAVTVATGAPFQRTERVDAGKTVTIEVPAFAADPAIAEPSGPRAETTGGQRRRSRVLVAYGVGAAGALSLVSGVVVGLRARGDYNAQFEGAMPNCVDLASGPVCNEAGFAAQNDAISLANVGTVLGVVGIAAIAGGAVLYLTAPKDVAVAPSVSAQSAGVSLIGRF
jgi:tetratricopeptide (TPR) repeat protein